MWTVIYITPDAQKAERIQDDLSDEGFIVKIRQAQTVGGQYEILVPESEVEEVQHVIGAILHP